MKIKTPELELLVAKFFGIRTNLIIPNLSWGMKLRYEADLTIVTRTKYCYEVELKVSKSDLIAEAKKKVHAHKGDIYKRFYYAMPDYIYDEKLITNDDAGILLAEWIPEHKYWHQTYKAHWKINETRKPKNKKTSKITDEQYLKLLELQAMRVWSMKKKNRKIIKKDL